jgi:hypothetical protein
MARFLPFHDPRCTNPCVLSRREAFDAFPKPHDRRRRSGLGPLRRSRFWKRHFWLVKKCAVKRRWTSADAHRPQTGSLHTVAEAAASSFDLLNGALCNDGRQIRASAGTAQPLTRRNALKRIVLRLPTWSGQFWFSWPGCLAFTYGRILRLAARSARNFSRSSMTYSALLHPKAIARESHLLNPRPTKFQTEALPVRSVMAC